MSAGTAVRSALLILLLAFLAAPERFAPVFAPLVRPGQPAIYLRDGLAALTAAHLGLVAAATAAAAAAAIGLAILVTRPIGAEFLPLARSVVGIGQTFPPVAVLALAVPAFGFGVVPTLVALVLYGLLPIFENALAGLAAVPPPVIEAARGMGMGPVRRLVAIELPLALPLILAGVRLSAVVGLGTATLGSTVAAKGLGEVIVAGLQADNLAYVVQGGLVVAAVAVLLHDGLAAAERLAARRARGA